MYSFCFTVILSNSKLIAMKPSLFRFATYQNLSEQNVQRIMHLHKHAPVTIFAIKLSKKVIYFVRPNKFLLLGHSLEKSMILQQNYFWCTGRTQNLTEMTTVTLYFRSKFSCCLDIAVTVCITGIVCN